MYKSKYYTCEEIDERLLKGYYDDAVSKGYSDTFEQFKIELASIKDIAVNKNNIQILDGKLTNEIDRSIKMDEYLDDKHSKGKIYCKSIIEYNSIPEEVGTYLQKDIDGDISLLVIKDSDGNVNYLDLPTDKVFIVGDSIYVRDFIKAVPIGYKEVLLKVKTPLDVQEGWLYLFNGQVDLNSTIPVKHIKINP